MLKGRRKLRKPSCVASRAVYSCPPSASSKVHRYDILRACWKCISGACW